MSVISMKQLLEAGVHFGHQTRRWNPKMGKYIFTARNDIHIINLEDTSVLVDKAYAYVVEQVKLGKTILFVGTKKQAQDAVKEEAERCGMYYINNRWLGGTLTNFKTIRSRIDRLNKINQMEKTGEFSLMTKKEAAKLIAERDKLEINLGGIANMTSIPGLIFVVDTEKEHICVKEARALNIPIVGLIDTNCNPDDVDVIIPGNDDAIRSVKLVASAIADAVIEAKEGVVLHGEEEVEENVEFANSATEVVPVEADETEEVVVAKPAKKAVKKELVNEEVVIEGEKEKKPAKEKKAEKPTEESAAKPAKKAPAKKSTKEGE